MADVPLSRHFCCWLNKRGGIATSLTAVLKPSETRPACFAMLPACEGLQIQRQVSAIQAAQAKAMDSPYAAGPEAQPWLAQPGAAQQHLPLPLSCQWAQLLPPAPSSEFPPALWRSPWVFPEQARWLSWPVRWPALWDTQTPVPRAVLDRTRHAGPAACRLHAP